jgi:hypothetical protein
MMIPKSITITHLGAETCVTGSCHLIQFQPDHSGGSTSKARPSSLPDPACAPAAALSII